MMPAPNNAWREGRTFTDVNGVEWFKHIEKPFNFETSVYDEDGGWD